MPPRAGGPAALRSWALLRVQIVRKPRASWSRIRRLRCSGWRACRSPECEAGPDGVIEDAAVTGYRAVAACPGCGAVFDRVHEMVVTRLRDVRRAADAVDQRWVKFQRKCGNPGCPRKMFTEQVPQLPPRCRAAARLRDQAGYEVTGRGITPAEAARHAGISGRPRTRRSPPPRTRCWTGTLPLRAPGHR